MLKRIGAEESGELKAIASGTLPSGKPVIVNADGTVSIVGASSVSEVVGTKAVFESAQADYTRIAYDPVNNKVFIAYVDAGDSNKGKCVVGTISGTSITYGSVTTFHNNSTSFMDTIYDTNAGKFVIVYYDGDNSGYGTSVVATVSGDSVTFGSDVIFNSANCSYMSLIYSTAAQKVVVSYRTTSDQGKSQVGTVSGTSISWGSQYIYNSGATGPHIHSTYDVANDRLVVVYKDEGNSNYGTARVGSISGTAITWGSETVFNAGNYTDNVSSAYDASAEKIIITYRDNANSNYGTAIVGTVSGTAISFGSEAVFLASNSTFSNIVYHPDASYNVIVFRDAGNGNIIRFVTATISGTSVSFGTVTQLNGEQGYYMDQAWDPVNKKIIVVYRASSNSDHGTAVAYTPAHSASNLTEENYIGVSRGTAFQQPVTQGAGSAVQYKAASIADNHPVIFDSNSNKTVIAYPDAGDSNKGKARVGTASGTSISFGTEATFTTNNINHVNGVFDSSNNKVVIVYRDSSNSSYGTAVVGTVSGTDITFGSPAVFNSANCFWFGIAFDSTNNKVVIAYRDQGNNTGHGSAIVGTVSGTSISFGSEATLESSVCVRYQLAYDTTNQKIVAVYVDGSSSGPLRSKVGTVSGTSISFGSEVTVDADTCTSPKIVFNPDTGTTIVTYTSNTDTFRGTSKIGTVSGTSISFSSESVYSTKGDSQGLVYDSTAQKIVISYRDGVNGNDGYIVVGTVGASSITYGTPLEFADYDVEWINSAFDSNLNKVVISYSDQSNSNYGTAVVFQNTGTETIRAEVASGQPVRLGIIGSVSDNQIGLTAGQQYFVQTDGTIGTTAADPSVLAGTAISATELVVKT